MAATKMKYVNLGKSGLKVGGKARCCLETIIALLVLSKELICTGVEDHSGLHELWCAPTEG